MPHTPDIVIAWTAVHGGSYHKLFALQDRLAEAGLSCRVLLSGDPPLGLQPDIDLPQGATARLAERDVHIVSLADMAARVADEPARLFLFPCSKERNIGDMAATAKRAHNAITAQTGYLLDDFHYWGVDHVFMQMPATLWFSMVYYRRHACRDLPRAKKIHFCGNVLYEATPNRWTSEVTDKASFFAKYGLDPAKPLLLWLPTRSDGEGRVYGDVIEAARVAGMNLVVKLHPWEYKNMAHGNDPRYGKGRTSADKWGVRAIDERDSSWAQAFCDLAVVSGSTVGIELAYWEKPVAYIRPWFWCGALARPFAVRLKDARALPEILRRRWPITFPRQAYATARAWMHPDPDRDSYALHVDAMRLALDADPAAPPVGSDAAVRALYAGRVPYLFREGNTVLGRLLGRFRDCFSRGVRTWSDT
ncbi:MAG: hypothetical protein AB7E47_15875 [Desulfovibrionaceae bacterium]